MTSPGPRADDGAVRARVHEILGDRTPAEVALVSRMLEGFSAKADRLLGEFDAASGRADAVAATRALHTAKGTALNLGLDRLASACQRWEDHVRAGGPPDDGLRRDVVDLVAAGARALARVADELLPDDAGVTRSG